MINSSSKVTLKGRYRTVHRGCKPHDSGIRRFYAATCAISRLCTSLYGDFLSPKRY